MKRAILGIACLAGLSFLAHAEEEGGKLRTYDRMTQIGTVACRDFHDAGGQLVRQIFYTQGMRVQSSRTYEYDDRDRIKKTTHFDASGILNRTLTYERGEDWERGTWRNADGIRTYLMVRGKGKHGDLYFDDTGERLVGARGNLPPDFDLADGWGRAVTGLVCGLGVSTKTGTLDEIELTVTIKNLRPPARPSETAKFQGSAELPMGSLHYKPRLISEQGKVFKAGDAKHATLNPHAFQKPIRGQRVHPGRVESRGSSPLSTWFEEIPAGRYQLLVSQPDEDNDLSLISNTIEILLKGGDQL